MLSALTLLLLNGLFFHTAAGPGNGVLFRGR